MDNHFRVLGISRGCDEAALKKAYRQKALALHPDRNPGGAEQFKKVNEAYEALCVHFRRNGGRDSANVQTTTGVRGNRPASRTRTTFFAFNTYYNNAGSGYQYARHTHTTEEAPHFTEEELFGSIPGDFTYDRRHTKTKFSTQADGKGAGGNSDSAGRGGIDPNARGNRGGYRFGTSEMYERADERWRRAHGERVPVSGYSMSSGAAPPPQYPPPQGEQPSMRPRPVPFPSAFTADVGGGVGGRRRDESARRNANERSRDAKARTTGCKGSNTYSHYTDDLNENDTYTFHPNSHDASVGEDESSFASTASPASGIFREFDMQQTTRAMHREWERLKKDMDCKMAGSASLPKHSWDGRVEPDVDNEEDYIVHKRPPQKREGETFHQRLREQQRLNEMHMREIVEERLQLKKILFTQRYTPDPADVALMSDSDVFVLCELLEEVGQRMQQVFNGRMKKGLCSRCATASKLQDKSVFTCGHTSTCAECAMTCGSCPVCAAARRG
ncbi:chaperone DnaJ protein [Trypanosoma rangeli]|uniref:Chaperone DnaJ protein n=1 Tax=Trypanosoma rangeli TaxID=5698 RepID=A0A3R7KD40_TRYRA|nr:chaperone DnaJ protein [Trypanosoma rangeli]RNE98099.1 chaperone DnaJ protein [Trypanosoma rangeli]|eukprot:RNE98099.1 chaperone DnaJ protein [Trypanosoma rangeli]